MFAMSVARYLLLDFFLKISSLHFFGMQLILYDLWSSNLRNLSVARLDKSGMFSLTLTCILESSAYLSGETLSYGSLTRSFKNMVNT